MDRKTLDEIREALAKRIAEREADQKRLEELKAANAEAIRGAETVKRILERA